MYRHYHYEENQSFVFGVFQKAPQRIEIKSRDSRSQENMNWGQ